jgi:hypothetical protein
MLTSALGLIMQRVKLIADRPCPEIPLINKAMIIIFPLGTFFLKLLSKKPNKFSKTVSEIGTP